MRPLVVVIAALGLAVACGSPSQAPSAAAPSPSPGPSASGAAAPSAGPTGSAPAGASPDTAWQAGPAAPLALTEVAAAAHDGRIWVAGGLTIEGRGTTAVQVFDPATGTWSDGPALPEAVHHSSLVSDGQSLYLLGGYTGDSFDRPTTAVRRLDGTTWTDVEPLPEARAAGGAAWDGTRLVYAGGLEPGNLSALVFVRAGGAWQTSTRISEAREHLGAASDGEGRVFILGGRTGGLETNLATVDVIEGQGSRRLGDLPTPRGGVAGFFWPTLGGCLAGGESVTGTNPQVECITADGAVTSLPLLAAARHGLGAVVFDGVAYVLLGGDVPGLTVSGTVETLRLP
jgi:hypothetical protein